MCLQCGRPRFDPWLGKILWRRKWQLTAVLLPGKSHGWRSMVGYSPWGCKESDTTEQLHFHFQEDVLSEANQPIQSLSGSLSTSPNHPQARPHTTRDKPCTRSLPQLFKLDSQKSVCLLRPLPPAETTGEALTHSSPASWPTRCFLGGMRRGPCMARPPPPPGNWDLLALP